MGNNGRFSDGFLMGAIAGGALMFLIGTKKGNKVLKLILEEGKVGFNELMQEIDELKSEARELQEEAVEEEFEEEAQVAEAETEAKQEIKSNGNNTEVKKTESTKRFFKKK